MLTNDILKTLLMIAWLLPLLGFLIEIFGAYWSDRKSKTAARLAVFCIGTSFVCSSAAFLKWGDATDWAVLQSHEHHEAGEHGHADAHDSEAAHESST